MAVEVRFFTTIVRIDAIDAKIEGGILTLSTGLDDSINSHSFIAILRHCLIRMRSL